MGVMRRRLGARPDVGERRGGVRTEIQRWESSLPGCSEQISAVWLLKLLHPNSCMTHLSDTWGYRRPRLRWGPPCCWTHSSQEEEAASWETTECWVIFILWDHETFLISHQYFLVEHLDLKRLSWKIVNPLLAEHFELLFVPTGVTRAVKVEIRKFILVY